MAPSLVVRLLMGHCRQDSSPWVGLKKPDGQAEGGRGGGGGRETRQFGRLDGIKALEALLLTFTHSDPVRKKNKVFETRLKTGGLEKHVSVKKLFEM